MEILKTLLDRPELLFCELIGGKPFKYQIDFLKCPNKKITFRAGRQVGKTTVCAIKVIQHALKTDKRQVLCLSPTQRQSGIIFRTIRESFRNDLLKPYILSESQTRIELVNGSEIICLPGDNPRSIMGFSPTLLIIDEAAFVKEDIFTAILPSLNFTKGELIFISTPFGKTGRFYQSFNDDSFSQFHVRCSDCPVNTKEYLEDVKSKITDMEYLQMYEGEFVESADAYFERDLVLSCISEIDQINQADTGKMVNYYIGIDCARYGLDETVYTIAEKDDKNIIRIVKIINTNKKPITDIIGRVQELHNLFNFKLVFMDASGLGAGAVDVLKEKKIPLKNLKGEIEGIDFTLETKEEMYKNLKLLMSQGRLKFPKNDKLINELTTLQYEFTENGHMKIHHPDTPNAHDDFSDSLALACLGERLKKYTPFIAT